MADEQAKLTLRNALTEFDTLHLQKLSQAAYDRWNWDSGSEADRLWYEVSNELLEERKQMSDSNGNISFSMNPNNSGNVGNVDVMTLDQCGDLILGTGASGRVAVRDGSVPNSVEHELFKVDYNHDLELGYELKRAMAKFISEELQGMTCTTDSSGRTIKQIIDTLIQVEAPNAVRNRL